MGSLEQILLLQKKVEIAVQKIERLSLENAALRKKCADFSAELSEKTALLSNFANDEKKIGEAIMQALQRLDSVENDLLDDAKNAKNATQNADNLDAPSAQTQIFSQNANAQEKIVAQNEPNLNTENTTQNVATSNSNLPIEQNTQNSENNGASFETVSVQNKQDSAEVNNFEKDPVQNESFSSANSAQNENFNAKAVQNANPIPLENASSNNGEQDLFGGDTEFALENDEDDSTEEEIF